MSEISLLKNGHRWIFRYEPDGEAATIDAIVALVKPGGIDWFDAATLSYELHRRVKAELDAMKP